MKCEEKKHTNKNNTFENAYKYKVDVCASVWGVCVCIMCRLMEKKRTLNTIL